MKKEVDQLGLIVEEVHFLIELAIVRFKIIHLRL